METKHIIRLENKEKVDLSTLSLDELYKLHFEEEMYAAKRIREFEPFSKSREEYFKTAYGNINKIKTTIATQNTKLVKHSKNNTSRIIEKVIGKIPKSKITLLELGCGNGSLLKILSRNENLKLYGCDLQETDEVNNAIIYNKTIYETLNCFDDNSIDLIIADNVCEHFLEDEADEIYDLISKKLNKTGYCIFFIPNLLVGPSDISKRFIKYKEKPLGFHYMEQTYSENIQLFNRHQLKTAYIYIYFHWRILIENVLNIPDTIKKWFEKKIDKLLENSPKNTRKSIFAKFGYTIYILKCE